MGVVLQEAIYVRKNMLTNLGLPQRSFLYVGPSTLLQQDRRGPWNRPDLIILD